MNRAHRSGAATAHTPARALALWCGILVLAVLNGTLREAVLAPRLGAGAALPLSGVLLSFLVLAVAWVGVAWLGPAVPRTWWSAGALWFVLTLLLELFMGRVLLGRSWEQVLGVFRFRAGDLFPLVLLLTGLAPRLAARLRGLDGGRAQSSRPSSPKVDERPANPTDTRS